MLESMRYEFVPPELVLANYGLGVLRLFMILYPLETSAQ